MADCDKPVIITVALTGNVPTKQMTPYVPCTPEEIVDDIEKCWKAGAVLFHIHARDENQKPCQDIEIFRKIVTLAKQRVPEAIIQLSTGARAGKDPNERLNVIRLCPEMGSFATGSNNLAKIIYENSPDFILQLAKVFKDTKSKPEIECFDTAHLTNALFLAQKKKLLNTPIHFNFVLGTAGGAAGTVKTMQFMADQVPEGSTWTITGVGKCQMGLIAAAIAMGGHVRVGVEDNISLPDGKIATNEEFVHRAVEIAKNLGRKVATVEEARKILGLDGSMKDTILNYLEPNSPLAPVDWTGVPVPVAK